MYLIFPRVKNVIKSHINKRAKRPAIPVCHVEFLRVAWPFLSSICSNVLFVPSIRKYLLLVHTGHGLVSVYCLASCPAAVTGILQPPFSCWLPPSQSC